MQILIFGDDKTTLKWVTNQIVKSGHCSFVTNTPLIADVLVLLRSLHFDAIIYDISFSGSKTKETVQELINNSGQVPIIILTGASTLPAAIDAVKMGAGTYLVKEKAGPGLLAECIAIVCNKKNRFS